MSTWTYENKCSKVCNYGSNEKKKFCLVDTTVLNDYSQLVPSSAAIAASICFKSRMDGLMKQADMYFSLGEKEKAMEIMAKLDCLRELGEPKDDSEPRTLLQLYTPKHQCMCLCCLFNCLMMLRLLTKKMKFHILPPQ
jgi:hypothetical protein